MEKKDFKKKDYSKSKSYDKKKSYEKRDKREYSTKRKPERDPKSESRLYPDKLANFNVISRLKTSSLGSILKVRHFMVEATDLGDLSYSKSMINSAINAFVTQRGYTSTVTYDVVQEYVNWVITLEMTAAAFVRTQNCVLLEDITGRKVGKAFYSPQAPGISTNAEMLFTGITGTAVPRFNDSLSNHIYSTAFVSPMMKILTTPQLHSIIPGLFKGVFQSNQLDDDAVFDVYWPDGLLSHNYTALLAQIAWAKSLLLLHPDLELILRSIGFQTFEELGEEFQRDRYQQSIIINKDGTSEAMLLNSKVRIPFLQNSEQVNASYAITNGSYPDTFIHDLSSDSCLLDVGAGIRTLNKVSYMMLKLFSTGIRFDSVYMMSLYLNAGIKTEVSLSIMPLFIAFRQYYFDDASLIEAGGGPGTGKLSTVFLKNLFSIIPARVGIGLPVDNTEFLSFKKGLNDISNTPEVTVSYGKIENTNGIYDIGNNVSVSDALDAQLYLNNRQVFVVFGIVE